MSDVQITPGISEPTPQPQPAAGEFQLEMVDLGGSYQAAESDIVACFRCYCGSGCLCGCTNL